MPMNRFMGLQKFFRKGLWLMWAVTGVVIGETAKPSGPVNGPAPFVTAGSADQPEIGSNRAATPLEQARQFKPALNGVLLDAIRALRERIETGPPFLLDERRARVARLEAMAKQPVADQAEVFRGVIEAYRIELDYGKTVEVTRGPLPEDSRKLVDFLSVGRLALYYQTLDGRESAIWSNHDRQWRRLSSESNELITEDIRMARKDIPPGLMTLPLPGIHQP